MGNHYIRVMLVQMFLLMVVIIWVGLMLKGRFTPLPPRALPMLVRNYGALLLGVPAAWCLWALVRSRRPAHDAREEMVLLLSGIAMCVLIGLFGWFAVGAAMEAPIILVRP